MDSPERLAGDQRAVLQLVLGQGRSYGEIAGLLSIAPEQVRARAHLALDALGPPTAVADAQRGQIADYLLGQLPAAPADAVRDELERSPSQRAWARVVAAELRPLARGTDLPRIPEGRGRAAPGAADQAVAPALAGAADHAVAPGPTGAADHAAAPAPPVAADHAVPPAAASDAGAPGSAAPRSSAPRSSRTGGIVLLALVAAAIVAAIVIFVINPGGGSRKPPAAAEARAPSSRTTTTSASPTTSASQSATIVGRIKLAPPTGGGTTTGSAFVLQEGALRGLGIEARHVPPTTTKPRTAYAVWLYNSAHDATRLGYVRQGVAHNGELTASAALPANAARYRLLIITLETGNKPSGTPGPVVLAGALSDVPKSTL